MWDGTIPLEGGHFPVRNDTFRVSDIRKCELEDGIVSSNFIDLHWLFLSQELDVYKNVLKIRGLMKNQCWISRIQYGSLFKLEQ
jgi:hypothetical protein